VPPSTCIQPLLVYASRCRAFGEVYGFGADSGQNGGLSMEIGPGLTYFASPRLAASRHKFHMVRHVSTHLKVLSRSLARFVVNADAGPSLGGCARRI